MMDLLTSPLLALSRIGAYALLAVGIVAIYRASKVLNLAHGAMALVPAYVAFSAAGWGLPAPVVLLVGILSGAAVGQLVERVFVRPLKRETSTTQTVGTVAAFGVIVAVTVRIWGAVPQQAAQIFPPGTAFRVGRTGVGWGEIGLLVVMLAVTAALFAVFRYTDLGLLMRGTAENQRAASLMGVNPQRITNLAWMLGGALAGLAGVLLAAVTTLNPFVLSLQALPAFVAALIGGLESFPGAVVGGLIVGLAFGFVDLIPVIGTMDGAQQLVIGAVAIGAMAFRGSSGLAGASMRSNQ